MSDIFISYARDDRARVEPLARTLIAEGLTVFWDQELFAGRSWVREVERAIHEASVVIVVWTSGSVESKWIREEAQLAQSLGTLLPVQLDMTRSAQPIAFRNLQIFDLSEWDGNSTDVHLQQLISLVRRRLRERASGEAVAASRPAVPLPTPAPATQPAPAPAAIAQYPQTAARGPALPSEPPVNVEVPPFLRRREAEPARTQAESVPGEVIAVPVPSALPAPVPQPPQRVSGVQPPDVFIAYSRKDLETCKHVVAALRSEGLEVFFDQYIEGGEEWREIIASNIKSCSVFMVLFSANSLKSPQVRKEVNHATDNSRSIVPLMIENVKLDGGLALELNGINFIPYFENPQQRLPEAVEKARNLAAIAVFDRRRDYQQAALGNSFVPMRSDVPVLHPSGSSPASWRRGVLALLGALLLASAGAALLAVATGRDGPVWVASIATALFFAALPYVIGVMMLFGRLVRS